MTVRFFLLLLPNFISLGRFLSVPILIYLIILQAHALAFWLFLAAGISDAVDGWIAKRFDAHTTLGAFLDPIADKTLLAGVYVTLAVTGDVAIWLVILVVFRDVVIVGGIVLIAVLARRPKMAPTVISKANTAAQITLATLILANLAFPIGGAALIDVLTLVTAATTLASGVHYALQYGRQLIDLEDL